MGHPRRYLSGMRTWFEIEETAIYLTVRETLLRRCEAWAAARGLAMAPSLAEALLDSRHFSTDGRLGYWTRRRWTGRCWTGSRGR